MTLHQRSLIVRLTLIALFVGVFTVTAQEVETVEVTAVLETESTPGDGATAAVIWLHPTNPALSLILGSDDNAGLGVYTLDGALTQFLELGSVNNLDVRYNFPYGSQRISIIAVGLTDRELINLYTVDDDTYELEQIGEIVTGIPHSGLCMYHSALTGSYYVFVVADSGAIEQYRISGTDGEITSTLTRTMNAGSEAEGCAADDDYRFLYIAEEDVALWRYGAEPEAGSTRRLVDLTQPRGNIVEQVEGLTIFYAEDGGYLIASNEQGDSFLVYERTGNNALVGQFQIGTSETVDQVSEPNGIDAVGLAMGEDFPDGLFIASDDTNSNPNADNNFKIASWGDIAAAMGLPLTAVSDPRLVGAVEAAPVPLVRAEAETDPVPSGVDAADDPAIWIHPTDVTLSTLITTDKTAGLVVYDLEGVVLQALNIGRINNVDVRYNFMLDGVPSAIVAATNRTENSLEILRVNDDTRELEDVAVRSFVSAVKEVYGVCLYVSPVSGVHYVFVNSADTGDVEQYALTDAGNGQIEAEVVREFTVGTQTEGCVVDDENAVIYIGEEAVGIWKYDAEPDADDTRVMVDSTDLDAGGHITADTEGLTLYLGADGTGYLIVSSQGSSEYVVYDREGDNAYVGTFVIVESEDTSSGAADAVSGTDGIDVTNFPLGDAYPEGLFIAQDDLNINPEGNQNFKLVGWTQIAEVLGLNTDTTFDPRTIGAAQ